MGHPTTLKRTALPTSPSRPPWFESAMTRLERAASRVRGALAARQAAAVLQAEAEPVRVDLDATLATAHSRVVVTARRARRSARPAPTPIWRCVTAGSVTGQPLAGPLASRKRQGLSLDPPRG